MGLSTKQGSVDQEHDQNQAVLQSGHRKLQENPLQLEPLKCPRCDSINTKFCYYNNYNKSQPRHFCKACKRHWTKGGTLRNVPVGGGRKNKKMKRSNSGTGSNSSKNQMGTQRQPQSANFPVFPQNDSMNSLSAKLLGNNGGFMTPQNEGLEFSLSNLSNFEINPPSLDPYCTYETKVEDVEDPCIINNLIVNTSSSVVMDDNQTWEIPSLSTNVMELPDFWNWNNMASADLNIPWDDDLDDGTMNHP